MGNPTWTRMIKLLVALTVAVLAATASAQELKIGYLNAQRIENESASARRATELLKQEFEPRNQQIAELQKRIAETQARFEKERDGLSAGDAQVRARELTDMMRQSDQTVMRLNEDFEQRKSELGARVFEDIRVAINAVAEAGKFDLVVQEVAFARSSIDITDQVLKEMAKRGASVR